MARPPATRISIEDIGARVLRSWLFFGVVSVAIVGLLALASWPWYFNRFMLTATTRVIEISASASTVHEIGRPFPKSGEIQIFNAKADDLPPELATLGVVPISVRLAASSATLQSIYLPNGAGLVVHMMSDGSADIGVLNGGSISLALSGMIERVNESGGHTTIANITRATAWNIKAAERNSPARLVVPLGAATIALYNQPISDFRFRLPWSVDEDPRTFQSEILKGELQLLDIATKIELQPRELILLEGGNRVLSRLEIIDKAVAVNVSGEADRISIGPPRPGFPLRLDRDVTPSVLSYLLGQHELKLLWGIALTVLATLWKARQWALKWGK
jgi:hypothetical protein